MYKFLKIILGIFLIGVGLVFAFFLMIALIKTYNEPSKDDNMELKKECFSGKLQHGTGTSFSLIIDGFSKDELNSTDIVSITESKNDKKIDKYSVYQAFYVYEYAERGFNFHFMPNKDSTYVIEQNDSKKYILSDFNYSFGYDEDLLDYFPDCSLYNCKINGEVTKECKMRLIK
jgi:hypothetical protein